MKKTMRGVVAAGLMLTTVEAGTACDVRVSDPTIYNIVEASNKYGLSDIGLLGKMTCESMLDAGAIGRYDGKVYLGLAQHRRDLWPARVNGYNKRNPNQQVSTDALDARASAFVTAEMIDTGGLGPWQCETDYHCYSNPNANKKKCKPQVWQDRVKRAGGVIIGSDVVFPDLVDAPSQLAMDDETRHEAAVSSLRQTQDLDHTSPDSIMAYAAAYHDLVEA